MDVSSLQPVSAATGPCATGPYGIVCADVTHASDNADTELELRARGVTRRLTEQGAPDAVVEAVGARLLEGNAGGEAGTSGAGRWSSPRTARSPSTAGAAAVVVLPEAAMPDGASVAAVLHYTDASTPSS